MKDLLHLILTNITLHPDDVSIVESTDADYTIYTVTVHPDDMGRIIGRNGKVIKAIRNLSHVVGIRHDKHYRISIAESGDPHSGQEPTYSEPESAQDDVQNTQDEQVDLSDSSTVYEAHPEPSDDIIADAMDLPEEEN